MSHLGLLWPLHERRASHQGLFYSNFVCFQQTSLQSANYVRTELPVRIARRIRDLQALPYVVVMQEGVTKVYDVSYIS